MKARDDRSRPTANRTASNVSHIDSASMPARTPCCGELGREDIAECSRRRIYCSPDSCAAIELAVTRELDLAARQAELKWMAECLEGSWAGTLSAALRDHAALIEVAHREGWRP